MKNKFAMKNLNLFFQKKPMKTFIKALKILKIILLIYFALYSVRFVQLNFTGRKIIKANTLPYCLLVDTEALLYHEDIIDETMVNVQYVDLNGDFKKEFIVQWAMFGYRDIYTVGKDNSLTHIGSPRSWNFPAIFVPRWYILGYPVIHEDGGKKLRWLGTKYEDSKY